jgi:NAD(P) transhydrogenase
MSEIVTGGADYDFDLVVIGSGPGGQRAAVQAAKSGKKVAIIEKNTKTGWSLCSLRDPSV